jgi:4-amino-4-deoxy-L-arabinose transferase-like glycosyltransferase
VQSHISFDPDEGVDLVVFRTVQAGSPLYQSTYFSQPPGFLLTIYPGYVLFGSTLEAARLAMSLWSLVGLLAVVWFACELKSPTLGFTAIGVLYMIPVYFDQTVTFQADALPAVFSMLALAAIIRFHNTSSQIWIILSALAAGMSLLTKGDVSVLPAVGLVMMWAVIERKEPFLRLVSHAGLFAMAYVAMVILMCLPFGLTAVYQNVVTLRILAGAAFPQDTGVFFSMLAEKPQLVAFGVLAILSSGLALFADHDARPPVLVLLAWTLSTFIILFFYHPLWQHHLTLLALPVALLFSLSVYKIFALELEGFVPVATLVLVVAALVSRFNYTLSVRQGIMWDIDWHGVDLVKANTQPGDYVVCDQGFIPVLAGRPIPPNLTDLSPVRIRSGGLSQQAFEAALDQYKPKMILLWQEWLVSMPNVDDIVKRHHYALIEAPDSQHRAYLLESQVANPGY